MGLPKDYRPREGDVVVVHAKVSFDLGHEDDGVHIRLVGAPHCKTVVPLKDIKLIVLRKWDAGDRVRSEDDYDDVGTVAAVGHEWVWVKLDRSDAYVTIHANSLEPAPVKPERETDEALRERIKEAAGSDLTDDRLVGWDIAKGPALDTVAARLNITRIGDMP